MCLPDTIAKLMLVMTWLVYRIIERHSMYTTQIYTVHFKRRFEDIVTLINVKANLNVHANTLAKHSIHCLAAKCAIFINEQSAVKILLAYKRYDRIQGSKQRCFVGRLLIPNEHPMLWIFYQ